MDHEIFTWLNSDQDYLSGLLLYDQYCKNTNLGRILRVGGATGKNRLTLIYELGKIVKHLMASDKNLPSEKLPQDPAGSKKDQEFPTEIFGIEKLRRDQKMLYKMLDNLHAILPYREIHERKEIALQILDFDDHLKEITERILHFEKHGVIPPEPTSVVQKKVSDLTAAELLQRQNNLRTYVTKYTRLLEDSKTLKSTSNYRDKLEKYQLELNEVTKRLRK
jgi:hypothetical protein